MTGDGKPLPSGKGRAGYSFSKTHLLDPHFLFFMQKILSVSTFLLYMEDEESNSFSSAKQPYSPEIDEAQIIEPGSSTVYHLG